MPTPSGLVQSARANPPPSPRSGTLVSVGGPLFVMWISPSEAEIVQRYNPELRARSMANRDQRAQDFDDFVCRLKQFAKSDRNSA